MSTSNFLDEKLVTNPILYIAESRANFVSLTLDQALVQYHTFDSMK